MLRVMSILHSSDKLMAMVVLSFKETHFFSSSVQFGVDKLFKKKREFHSRSTDFK